MRVQGVDRRVRPPGEDEVEIIDVTDLAFRQTGGQILGRGQGCACPYHVTFPASVPGPLMHGPERNWGRLRWRGQRPRLRRDKRSMPDRSRERKRRAPRPKRCSQRGRLVCEHIKYSKALLKIYLPPRPSRKGPLDRNLPW